MQLVKFRRDNNSYIEKDLADIRCTVTFEKAITLNELKTICTSNEIDLKVIETRHIINGKKYTSATIFNGNFEDLQNEINEITDDLGGGFVGVIDVYACIDSEYVDDVKRDQKVFLVDVSGDAASIGYYIKNGDTRNKERFDDGLNDFPHAMSWDLEELR